ncbi:MAG: DNA-binding protein [Desulfomonilaceae bacterium]|nr:DNA-binding protein [Desulfomonilaceae bacterium]
MKSSEGRLGRVFVLRLEDGDVIPDCIERFASEHAVEEGFCALLGGVGGGRLVVGPEDRDAEPVVPMVEVLTHVHEAVAFGTIFPGKRGVPTLHMHAALGRENHALTGCVRKGVEVWKIAEVVLLEIRGSGLKRRVDPRTGFEVLSADPEAVEGICKADFINMVT